MKKIIFIFLFIFISVVYLPTTEEGNFEETKIIDRYNKSNIVGKLEFKNTDISMYLVESNEDVFTKDKASLKYFDKNTIKNYYIYADDNNNRCDILDELINYTDEEYYKEHKIIFVGTDNVKNSYQIFSIIKVEVDSDIKNMTNQEYINYLQTNSIFSTSEEVNYNEQIISIKTCYYNPIQAYLLIHAKRA